MKDEKTKLEVKYTEYDIFLDTRNDGKTITLTKGKTYWINKEYKTVSFDFKSKTLKFDKNMISDFFDLFRLYALQLPCVIQIEFLAINNEVIVSKPEYKYMLDEPISIRPQGFPSEPNDEYNNYVRNCCMKKEQK